MPGVVMKAVELNILPLSKSKESLLDNLFFDVSKASNDVLSIINSKFRTFAILHYASYPIVKRKFHSQIAVDVIHQVWESLDTVNGGFKNVPIRYNVPRSGALVKTKRGNPIVVVSHYRGEKRFGMPIKQDGAWNRFQDFVRQGYTFTQFRIIKRGKKLSIIVNLKKEFEVRESKTVVGVDVNSGSFAVTVYNGKILKQLYLGQDIWHKQWQFMKRRAELQSKGARRALKRLKSKERKYIRTRMWQEAHKIVGIAKQYNAMIAIENLRYLRRGRKRRISNRKIHRIPYGKFKSALESVAWQNNIFVKRVSPRNTSKLCSRCGNIGIRRDRVFKCKCGYVANADRNASVNIAKRALFPERANTTPDINVFSAQNSGFGGRVNDLVWCNEWVSECLQHSNLPLSTSSVL